MSYKYVSECKKYLFIHNIYAVVKHTFIADQHATDSDLHVTAAASLPTELSRDTSQVENVLSSKRHHSTSVGRRTRRKLSEDVQESDRDDEQVHKGPENCMETQEGDRDEEQV